jgi:hypothetical protein
MGAESMSIRTRATTLTALVLLTTGCQLPETLATPTTREAPELAALDVRPEDTGHDYDRDNWPHWSYVGDGCDVRDQVLQEQGTDVRVSTDGECTVTGTWVSIYDGVTVTDSSELDIDHLVALGEAADSGVRDWSESDREAFANDLDQLVAVTARSNRSKSDQDPAEWLPELDRCGYVTRWIEVKTRYELSVDQAEHDAIAAVLAQCPAGQ